MKLFLDSAKTDEIKHALALRDVDGITTNPRHAQAWHAARAGAAYISPFLGWKEQYGDSTTGFIQDIRTLLDNFHYKSEIIAAAIRNTHQLSSAAVAGAHCATAALSLYQESFKN